VEIGCLFVDEEVEGSERREVLDGGDAEVLDGDVEEEVEIDSVTGIAGKGNEEKEDGDE
jgi:hypothetical protein